MDKKEQWIKSYCVNFHVRILRKHEFNIEFHYKELRRKRESERERVVLIENVTTIIQQWN